MENKSIFGRLRKKDADGAGGQTLVEGALILTVGIVLTKIIGAGFKIPLANIIGESGMGYFNNAYALYTPVYTLAAAGFPAALSRQVAENITLGRYKDAKKVRAIAQQFFLITGSIGFALMAILGRILTSPSGIYSPNALYAILAMSPSVFFCCVMSSYRGYTEGLRNMKPTAVSQVIEALVKLIIGLGAAILVMKGGESRFNAVLAATGKKSAKVLIYGVKCRTLTEAMNASCPWAAAAAIFGVTFGSALGLVYLIIRLRMIGPGVTQEQLESSPEPQSGKVIFKKFLLIGIPIALGILALNLTQLIDSLTVQWRIAGLDMNLLRKDYGDLVLSLKNIPKKELPKEMANFLWGAYCNGITLFNLVPYITQALGVSAIPALASAWTAKDKPMIREHINAVTKIAVLISFPAGVGMFALSKPILDLLYPGKPTVELCAPMLSVLGIAVMFGALAAPINNMLQAIGKQWVPVTLMAIGAVIKLTLNYILVGTQSVNIKGAPWGTLACYAFMVVGSLYILINTTGVKLNLVTVFVKPFAAAAVCGLLAFGTNAALSIVVSSRISVIAAIVVGVAGYAVTLILTRAISKEDILLFPKGEKFAKILEKRGWIV